MGLSESKTYENRFRWNQDGQALKDGEAGTREEFVENIEVFGE